MSMTTTVIITTALDVVAIMAVLALAVWAIRTGQKDVAERRDVEHLPAGLETPRRPAAEPAWARPVSTPSGRAYGDPRRGLPNEMW
jgi:hypothetical protein